MGAAQFVLMASGALMAHSALADDTPAKDDKATNTVVVVGQRAALESAAARKRTSDEIIDSVVADDIGKLPDKSVTEVLQRMPGVTIDRVLGRADPLQGVGEDNRFAAEGSGVSVRGLSYVRSELNGRDSFSANGGRALSFEDVPPELLAGIDVYKNPSAERIEGAIGGLVDLRTHMPFDFKGFKGGATMEASHSQLRGSTTPAFSAMLSNRWNTGIGQVGALIDLSRSKIATRSNGEGVGHYFPRTDAVVGDTSGTERWIPTGVSWNTGDYDRTREGIYGALQWKKGDWVSGLTYFKSKYKLATAENQQYMFPNPRNIQVSDATFDSHGALLTGTLTNPADGGLGFGTNARSVGRNSATTDYAWNTTWKASDQWAFDLDLQHTRSTTEGYDNLAALNAMMAKQRVDLSGDIPKVLFDDADRAFLSNPASYNWDSTQQHRDVAVATQNSLKLDAKFTFDHPVLQDLRFGVRATDRDSLTQSNTPNSQWSALGASWAVGPADWQPLSSMITLGDPRFTGLDTKQSFNGFFNGKTSMPALVVPDMSLTTGGSPPPGFAKLHDYVVSVCKPAHLQDGICNWTPAPFGDPIASNKQRERTQAIYSQLRFGFDNLRYPVDGNVGVRVVRTKEMADGYTLLSATQVASGLTGVPIFAAMTDKVTLQNTYTNVLPTLNLRMKASDQLQFRFAASQGIAKPDFYRMQAYTTLSETVKSHADPTDPTKQVLESVTFTGSANGNTMLKPTRSNNLDLTAEYYFGKGDSLTLALFNKRLKDIVIDKTTLLPIQDVTGQSHDFQLTSPVNGARGRVTGMEIGYQQYFDKLPGLLSGLGVSANYTYIDSKLDMGLPANRQWCTPTTNETTIIGALGGCDTDGRYFGDLPVQGLSKNAYNLALLYDKGPVSARLAYSWRSKAMTVVHTWGTYDSSGISMNPDDPNRGNGYSANYVLPAWSGAYGQLDMGIQYKATENLSVNFDASNLTDALYKSYNQQGIGLKLSGVYYTGRRYTVSARYSF
jgi:TonB-dependent receptor